MKIYPLIISVFLVAACASTPKFETTGVDFSLNPAAVTQNLKPQQNKKIIWGGVIINTSNLKTYTAIEMLAYPIDSSYLPLRDQKPLGRFLIHHDGFLEPSEYAQGRMLSVLGKIERLQKGNVGESVYLYSVIRSQQLHLWPADSGQSKTRFSFGIGVRL